MQTYTDTDNRVWNIKSRRWTTLHRDADDTIVSMETVAIVAPDGYDEATKELVITEKVEPAQAAALEAALAWQPKLAVDSLVRKEPIETQPVEEELKK